MLIFQDLIFSTSVSYVAMLSFEWKQQEGQMNHGTQREDIFGLENTAGGKDPFLKG